MAGGGELVRPPKPRRQRKDNSARAKRYRAKKKSQLDCTLADVAALRERVRELSTLRQLLSEKLVATPLATTGSPLRFVHEYFEVFRYGMQLPPARRPPGQPANKVVCGARQEQFFSAFVQPDVRFGETVGFHQAMQQWRMYSSVHASLFLEFVSFRMDAIANATLVSTVGVLHMGYTRATVATLFPHALAREALVAKLAGKEIRLRYTDHWYFDESGKVVRYELFPEMVDALHEAVGSLGDVAWLLGGGALLEDRALIKPDAAARIEQLSEDEESDVLSEEERLDRVDRTAAAAAAPLSPEPSHSPSLSMSPPPPPAAMAIEFLLS
ncbi:hypothetical protein PybrP1_000460 [[Pythium] brassicae (nom. inval.)]|nr:hypothetical protein PybrP1_000460 [[Pythium] brassicae (nom. inval.)]